MELSRRIRAEVATVVDRAREVAAPVLSTSSGPACRTSAILSPPFPSAEEGAEGDVSL